MAQEYPGSERKKHRHDLGQEDHGSKLAAGTTRAIQTLLGLWIALTLAFLVYVLVDASRLRPEPVTAAGASERSSPNEPAAVVK